MIVAPLWAHAQSTVLLEQQQRTISAFAVLTEQVNTSATQKNNSLLQAQQALSSSAIDIDVRDAVRNAVEQYGTTGQLVDGCYQLGMATQMGTTSSTTADHASSSLAKLYTVSANGTASAGGVTGALGATTQVTQFPYTASVSQRAARHASHYCTVSEAQLGYCTLNANGMQGGDEDFSLHLQPGKTYGWDQTEAAADFIKRVAPITPVSQAAKCASPECIAALAARRDQETMMSMARFSFLRFTESHETQSTGTAGQQ
ncbi:hypothetical protein [Paraburkholderia domus]|uniref:hypothetical protein n=1 Tax=Paraburkholderia domus TaxID=2793075 RepID=UPI001EF0F1B6|nr:hypothetical protein [Paraburkholderia domus]